MTAGQVALLEALVYAAREVPGPIPDEFADWMRDRHAWLAGMGDADADVETGEQVTT